MECPTTVSGTETLNCVENRYLPVDFDGTTSELKLKAKIELHETEDGIRSGLQRLKELIKEEGIVTCCSDEFILMFLRCKKFDLKRSYEQLKEYSYQRHLFMNYYGFMSEDRVMPVFRNNICGILPKRDHEGRVIIYFRGSQFSSQCHEKMDPDDVLRAIQVLGHFVLMYPATQISGLCIIADMRIESIEVLQLLFKYVRWALQNIHAFPGRIQKVDCINTNIVVRTLMNLIRPVMPSKILKRTSFHGSDYKDLLKFYDPSLLPEEFGGTLGPINEISEKYFPKFEQYISKLHTSNRYFTRQDTIPYPESKSKLTDFFH